MAERNRQVIEELEGKHFDIGLAGVWYGTNYGSVMTYYALYQILTRMGYSVLMIDKLLINEKDFELSPKIHSRVFAAKHYPAISPSLPAGEMELLNQYSILTVPESKLEEVSRLPQVEYMEKPKRLYFSVGLAKTASCITYVQVEGSSYSPYLTGKGCLVAVIDSGESVIMMTG